MRGLGYLSSSSRWGMHSHGSSRVSRDGAGGNAHMMVATGKFMWQKWGKEEGFCSHYSGGASGKSPVQW